MKAVLAVEQLKIYQDPKEFYKETSLHLKKAETINCLMLGLCFNFQSDSKDCLYQSALFDDDRLIGAVVLSRYETNHNFLPSPVKDKKHARPLFEGFLKNNVKATGIVGDLESANLYKAFFEEKGHSVYVNMSQGVYRCSKVKTPEVPSGLRFRVAETKDIQTIARFAQDFHKEAVPHDPPIDGKKFAEQRIAKQMLYVVEKADQLVACASWARDIGSSCSINFVYTPKEHRKNGYGSIVTALLTQKKLNEGKAETNLFTDMTNPTSNKIYQNIGYEFVGDSIHYGIK